MTVGQESCEGFALGWTRIKLTDCARALLNASDGTGHRRCVCALSDARSGVIDSIIGREIARFEKYAHVKDPALAAMLEWEFFHVIEHRTRRLLTYHSAEVAVLLSKGAAFAEQLHAMLLLQEPEAAHDFAIHQIEHVRQGRIR